MELATKINPSVRCCGICGKIGGSGSTTILRFLGYDIPDGQIGYAHPACIIKARKKNSKR